MMNTTDAAALAAHLEVIEAMEQRGAELLDAGANPAKLASDILCVVLRLQCEDRFLDVDAVKLEDVLGQIVAAQEDERGR